jgi:hypothetical protein
MAPKKAAGGADKAKKVKKPKDPNAPKKPSGAYIFFCNDKRASVKKLHPEDGVAQIGRQLGELWKTTSDEDKKKYYTLAEKDKERYQREIKTYHANQG